MLKLVGHGKGFITSRPDIQDCLSDNHLGILEKILQEKSDEGLTLFAYAFAGEYKGIKHYMGLNAGGGGGLRTTKVQTSLRIRAV